MSPFGGAGGLGPKGAKRAAKAAVAGAGAALLVPVIVVVLVVAVASSPINAVGHWLGDLFGGGGNSTMVCPAGASSAAIPTGGGTMSYAAIEGVWIKAGGPPQLAPVMAAVAFAESSGIPSNIQKGQPYGQTGWGLWQITPGNSVPQYGIDQQMLIPLNNARAAVYKYRSQGLTAWTTWRDGAYIQYLKSGVGPTASGVLQEAPLNLPPNSVYATYINSVCTPGGSPTLTLTKGPQATILPNGTAAAPKTAPAAVKAAINAANQIHTYPYSIPTGSAAKHYGPLSSMWPAYDCSGSTSYVLYKAGLHDVNAQVSGDLESWGAPGPGKWITIYANSGHVFMDIAGLAFNTAHYVSSTPFVPDTPGPRWAPGSTIPAQIAGTGFGAFVVRHPPGL